MSSFEAFNTSPTVLTRSWRSVFRLCLHVLTKLMPPKNGWPNLVHNTTRSWWPATCVARRVEQKKPAHKLKWTKNIRSFWFLLPLPTLSRYAAMRHLPFVFLLHHLTRSDYFSIAALVDWLGRHWQRHGRRYKMPLVNNKITQIKLKPPPETRATETEPNKHVYSCDRTHIHIGSHTRTNISNYY